MRAEESRVFVVAPVGQDAEAMVTMLRGQGIMAVTCAGPGECLASLEGGAGALLLAEEAFELPGASELLESFSRQPAWSELPLIVLTSGGDSRFERLLQIAVEVAGGMTLLERPMRAGTLLHSVQVVLRSRQRQYQVRDLLAERERFRALVTATSDVVYRMSSDWKQMFHLQGKGFIPDTDTTSDTWLNKYIHPQDQPQVQAAIDEAIRTKTAFEMEHRVFRIDGTLGWTFSRAVPLLHDDKIVEWFGVSTDITERKEFQTQLERLVAERTAELREIVGELEHFSYSITHDMRAPLRAMMGFAEVASELCCENSHQEQKLFLDRIQTAAKRMDLLITDALNYSKTVRCELPLAPVDVGWLLRGMVDTYPELQRAREGIRIDTELPMVMGNEAGLTQCFSNLLGNAVNFAKPGQTPEIRVWAEVKTVDRGSTRAFGAEELHRTWASGEWVRLWVEDRGIGIGPKMLPRVFDMFARGSSEQAGTGIGLALVRKVVERMGGRVGVESEEGKGSRFWVELRSGM